MGGYMTEAGEVICSLSSSQLRKMWYLVQGYLNINFIIFYSNDRSYCHDRWFWTELNILSSRLLSMKIKSSRSELEYNRFFAVPGFIAPSVSLDIYLDNLKHHLVVFFMLSLTSYVYSFHTHTSFLVYWVMSLILLNLMPLPGSGIKKRKRDGWRVLRTGRGQGRWF